MLLTLLRHGETTGRPGVFRGRSDPGLSTEGWLQLQRAASGLEQPRIRRLISSPSCRCREFAVDWAQQHDVPLTVVDSLREIDFGEWEELTPEEARLRDAQCYAHMQSDPEHWCSPGGEPYGEFRRRVLTAVAALCVNEGDHIGIVTHAGVIRVVLSDLLSIKAIDAQRIAIAPATVCRLWYGVGQRGRLLALHSEATSWLAG